MAFYKGVYGSIIIIIIIAENIWFHYVMNRDIKCILFEELLGGTLANKVIVFDGTM